MRKIKKVKEYLLSDFFIVARGKRLKQSDREQGSMPLVTAGFQNDGIACYISNTQDVFENAITIDMFGNSFWRPYQFSCDDNVIVLRHKFLNESTAFYFLSAIQKTTKDFNYSHQYRMKDLAQHFIRIPVDEKGIVDLDSIKDLSDMLKRMFELTTKLNEKLSEELSERIKQFNYFRDDLMTFPDNISKRTIGELSTIVTKQTGFDYSNYIKPALLENDNGDSVPYMQTKNFSGLLFDYNTDYFVPNKIVSQFPKITLDMKCILFSIVGASIGNVGLFPNEKKCFLGGAICVAKPKENVNIEFVYHYMSSKYGQKQIAQKTKGAGQATVTVEDIRNMTIPMPGDEKQKAIVTMLNKFDSLSAILVNRINEEINNRKKQYEYYRDLLLDF